MQLRFQEQSGLDDGDIEPGTPRTEIEDKMTAFAAERRLANGNGRERAATYERQLKDGRWVQVNELVTRDGGTVSVGADITQIKQHQEKLVDSERRLMATITLEPGAKGEGPGARAGELNPHMHAGNERAEAATGQVLVPRKRRTSCASRSPHHRLSELSSPASSATRLARSRYVRDIHGAEYCSAS